MSPLIKIAAPPQPIQGMSADAIVRPGGQPPLVHPHCRKCGVPVERFTIDPISSWYYLGVDAQCHGKTQGIRIPVEQALRGRTTGEVIWMFTS